MRGIRQAAAQQQLAAAQAQLDAILGAPPAYVASRQ